MSGDGAPSEGLVVDGLVAGYGHITILRGVDLAVPPGEVVAVLGSNGAGKTTLLNSLFGLTDVRAGGVSYEGHDLLSMSTHGRAGLGIAYITDGRAIYRGLTVAENLDMFARGRVSAEQLDRVFSVFPVLKERRRQTAGTLSGGQQQMLALSLGLVRHPSLLVVDELSMGLAPVVIDELFDVLARLKAESVSILMVEQYAHRALTLADVVYVLHRGRVVFAGEPHELAESSELLELYVGGVA